MPDHGGDELVTDKKLARSLVRQFKRNARAAAEHVKYDPWLEPQPLSPAG
jgi:hypothetical protein